MKISMIGTGYVGLVSGALFADRGNRVVCIDNNAEKIKLLKEGRMPFFEPGLEEIVRRNTLKENIFFSEDIRDVVDSKAIFLAVGTPSDGNGAFHMEYLEGAARGVGRALRGREGFWVIVGKSTVPQGTYKRISKILEEEIGNSDEWAYVSNPETLAEGSAVKDFSKPDRVLIGTYSDKAYKIMAELYHPFVRREDRIMRGSPADAELAKLFSNSALACRIAMINEFARIADVTKDADMENIRKMICEDSRIGHSFMYPGPGYGGSCFPKDVRGLVNQAKLDGYSPLILDRIHDSNEIHKSYMASRVVELLKREKDVKIGIWGVTFKPFTDDMRDAASIPIITHFINNGIKVSVYEPQAEKAREIFRDKVDFVNGQYEAVKDADALILLTEWPEFDSPDYELLLKNMGGRQLFDLRNRWLADVANENGFDYFGVGRNYALGTR